MSKLEIVLSIILGIIYLVNFITLIRVLLNRPNKCFWDVVGFIIFMLLPPLTIWRLMDYWLED